MRLRNLFQAALVVSCCAGHAADGCWEAEGCYRVAGVGLGVMPADEQMPLAQRQLMAMRAAKVDALRALAEQVKGLRIQSQSTTQSSTMTFDQTVTNVDTNLQGVRYVRVEPIQPGIYQAVVEIDLYR